MDCNRNLPHMMLLAALLVFAQDLSSRGGAQAWSYNYNIRPNRKWDEARQWCQQNYTDMVSIRNKEENDFLNNLLPFYSKYYWIGIHKEKGGWIWAQSNNTVPQETQNWAQNEPDDISAQDCVEIYIKRDSDTGKWNNESCRKRKGTICYTVSCTQDSCNAHADCVETIGNYTCKCHPGFTGSSCQEAIACKPLLDPEHGSHSCIDPYGFSRFNSSCRFQCELGFRLVGVSRLLCQASGQWNHPVPLCRVKECLDLDHVNISAGSMNCSHPVANYSYNSTCEVRCNEGYELRGQDQIRCDHTGKWTGSVPACTVKKCSPILFPVTGNMTCVDTLGQFSFSSKCNFTCQEGYNLTGDNTLTCLASGQWSNPTPTCKVVQCNSLKAPPYASMQCQDPLAEYSYGSICAVKCVQGFDRIGANMTKCLSQGNWSHEVPFCQAKRCLTLSSPSHGSLNCSGPHGEFRFGSHCTSTCEKGFVLNGTADTECNSLGMWSSKIPRCLAQPCPLLAKAPQHGRMNCSDPYLPFSFGSLCDFECNEGFRLKGEQSLTCNSSGHWSQDLPNCQRECTFAALMSNQLVQCNSLKAPPYASMQCQDPLAEYSYGSICAVKCVQGFDRIGANMTKCLSQGNWSHEVPFCQAKRCLTLSSPSHGSLNCSGPHGEFRFGTHCTSTCEKGFVLNGTADTECNSLGMWSSKIPRCLAQPCPLLAKAPQHGRMNCSDPYLPFSFGSLCDFECNEGFRLKGEQSLTCNSSGHWSQDLPNCQPVQCGTIHALSLILSMNCSHPLEDYSFGSQCNFTCKEGFSLNGTEVLFCSSTGLWNDNLPRCTVEGMPLGTALLMYTGVGAASVVVPLLLIGLAFLIVKQFKKKGNAIVSDSPTWGDRENPAFEF
ncbi:P-selectin [Tautogolabrus adspersus]